MSSSVTQPGTTISVEIRLHRFCSGWESDSNGSALLITPIMLITIPTDPTLDTQETQVGLPLIITDNGRVRFKDCVFMDISDLPPWYALDDTSEARDILRSGKDIDCPETLKKDFKEKVKRIMNGINEKIEVNFEEKPYEEQTIDEALQYSIEGSAYIDFTKFEIFPSDTNPVDGQPKFTLRVKLFPRFVHPSIETTKTHQFLLQPGLYLHPSPTESGGSRDPAEQGRGDSVKDKWVFYLEGYVKKNQDSEPFNFSEELKALRSYVDDVCSDDTLQESLGKLETSFTLNNMRQWAGMIGTFWTAMSGGQ